MSSRRNIIRKPRVSWVRADGKNDSLPPLPFKVSDDTAADWYSVHVPFRTVPTDKTPSAQPCLQALRRGRSHGAIYPHSDLSLSTSSLLPPAMGTVWPTFTNPWLNVWSEDISLMPCYCMLISTKMPLTVRLSICKGSEQDWLRKWCCGTFSLKSLGSRGGKHHTSFLEVTVDTVRRRVVLTDDSIMYQR